MSVLPVKIEAGLHFTIRFSDGQYAMLGLLEVLDLSVFGKSETDAIYIVVYFLRT
jgi:hypothetical protein